MPEPLTNTRIGLLVNPTLVCAIDSWRRLQSDLPTRNEAVRRLLTEMLTAKGKGFRAADNLEQKKVGI